MAYDVPKLGGYQITNPPESMSIIPEVVQQTNELADGGTRQRILGYRVHNYNNFYFNFLVLNIFIFI